MTEEEIKAVIQEIHDSVYEQGRQDAIEECISELGEDYWNIAKLQQLKEQK